ncbi:MAG: hypothetical protein HRT88_13140 [Lentisphaeraceae bacterium]|nr:hypothetical protein [Lentisphaeraceae bacterium]
MKHRLRNLKREAKILGIETNNFIITKDSTGEYSVQQYGKTLAQGYDITECRIFAIEEMIDALPSAE